MAKERWGGDTEKTPNRKKLREKPGLHSDRDCSAFPTRSSVAQSGADFDCDSLSWEGVQGESSSAQRAQKERDEKAGRKE